MSPIIPLLLAALTTCQTPETEPAVRPRLTRGQELVYRGRFDDESRAGAAPVRHSYDLEVRAFVLEVTPPGAQVAFLTTVRPSGAPAHLPGSARLELAQVDPRGRVLLRAGAPLLVPLDGPPLAEPAGFIELPAARLADGVRWDMAEGQRPPRSWRVAASDFHKGGRCYKLVGVQQSPEWDQPADAAPAWRRTDTAWLSPQTGMVQRLERTVERRGGDGAIVSRATTAYEYENGFVYPGQLGDGRRQEIRQAWQLAQRLDELLPRAGALGPAPFDRLIGQIDHHLSSQPQTDYRPALLTVRQRAEAARRGDAPPADASPEAAPAPAAVGRPAPDFVAADLRTGANLRLARWRGRPAVLLFYRPGSITAASALRAAQALQDRFGERLRVAVLAVADEDRGRQECAAVGLTVPLLAGREAAPLYGADAAPRVVVLDAAGVVRHLGDGWGAEAITAVARVVESHP